MAKRHILADVKDNLIRLKALIGLNVVISLFIDETDLLMYISFHKIPKLVELKPLTVAFMPEDFEQDPAQVNVLISQKVREYVAGRPKPSETVPQIPKTTNEEKKA